MHGVYKYENGCEYKGTWNTDQLRHGLGHLSFADGSKYSGMFRHGLCSGLGVMVFQDTSRYEGEFEDGRYHGLGVFTRCDGMRYQGEFKDGKMLGRGLITFADGTHGVPRNEGYFAGNRLVKAEPCHVVVEKSAMLAEQAREQC